MRTLRNLVALLLFISLYVPLAQAQSAQDVQIIISQDQVRFTAKKGVAEMHLQVYDLSGQMVYDSGARTEPDLTWVLRQVNGDAVNGGLYLYTLSVKEAGAETARVKRGHLIIDRATERDAQTDRRSTSQNESGTVAGTNAASGHNGAHAAEGAAPIGLSELKKKKAGLMELTGGGITNRLVKFSSVNTVIQSGVTDLDGRIGIGSGLPVGDSFPASKFHVISSASEIMPPRLQSSATNTFAAGWDFYHGTTGAGYVGVPDASADIAPGEMLVYGVGATSLWSGRQRSVTITQAGNVGIGTSTPDPIVRLHVADSITAVKGVSPNGWAVIGVTTNGIGVIGESADPSGYAGFFNGKVSIAGNLTPFGTHSIGQPDNLWGAVYAVNGTIQTSDARLKKGVADIRYGLRELMQLRPVSFEWKDNSDGQQHLGLIAQETEKIIPEAVTHPANADTPLGMNYTTLIPVMIKAIQEQQNTLTALKNENAALQERNAILQRQNADLETRLTRLEQTAQRLVIDAIRR
ncbi:MAG TPA: tail fiber domain-containing protein [Blastocatellia bacterium]|nr:tail fiber domain-containing protein [Blastocatellia bacterium]